MHITVEILFQDHTKIKQNVALKEPAFPDLVKKQFFVWISVICQLH